MTETILWLLLAVVMYIAGRIDTIREIESNGYDLEWINAHQIRLTRVRPAADTAKPSQEGRN